MQKVIAFITDTHLGDASPQDKGINCTAQLEAVLADIALQNATDIVFAGDITEPKTYEWFFNRMQTACPDFKAILGNHDSYAEAVKHYKQPSASSTELYYTYEDAYHKYIYLDSSSSTISADQLAWLDNEIETSKIILLFIHHPILKIDTAMDKIYPLQNRDALRSILHQLYNDVFVFCGHYHMPDYLEIGNVRQYITPSTSFQIKKESDFIDINTNSFGYRIITLDYNNVTTHLRISRNGAFTTEAD